MRYPTISRIFPCSTRPDGVARSPTIHRTAPAAKTPMTARSSLMFTVLALAAPGCSDVSGPNPAEQIYSAALAQWNLDGPASYDMLLKRECVVSANCQAAEIDVTIEVRDEAVTSRVYTATCDPGPCEPVEA